MGIPDGSLLDLIVKVRSWITSDPSDSSLCYYSSPKHFETTTKMPILSSKTCNDCGAKIDGGYYCLSCGRLWCKSCCYSESDTEERQEDFKKLCRECDGEVLELRGKGYDKVHPRDSPDSPPPFLDCRNIASIRCYPSR